MKFATFLLLALPSAEASRLFKNEPALQDTSLVQFTAGTDGSVESETVASDFHAFVKAWGIDLKDSWYSQSDPVR